MKLHNRAKLEAVEGPLMREDYQFLDLGGEQIFSALHYAAGPAKNGIVICHPLGEEKLWAHRVLVSFARAAAASGFAAIRFDFRGEGDSDRDFEQSDLETRVQDTNRAIDALREHMPSVDNISLVGLRLGASVAAVTASRRSDVSRLILWDPVVDGSAYMHGVLRVNLMYQMVVHRKVIESREMLAQRLAEGKTVNIEGYELGNRLFAQVSALRLQDVLHGYHGDTLIAQVSEGETPANAEFDAIANDLDACRVVKIREEAFWREIRTFYQQAPELTRVTLEALGSAS